MFFNKEKQVSGIGIRSQSRQITSGIQLLISMIKYMLECGDLFTTAIGNIGKGSNLNDKDLNDFYRGCSNLEQKRKELVIMGQNFLELLSVSTQCNTHIPTQSNSIKRKNCRTQTCDQDIKNGEEMEKKRVKKQYREKCTCLCDNFTNEVQSRNEKGRIIVCSASSRSRFLNEYCGCSFGDEIADAKNVEDRIINPENDMNDDSHPFILKSDTVLKVSNTGVGYEMFGAMRRYGHRVAQYVEETDESQTFAELLRDCTSVAVKLKTKGLNENDIVCLCARVTKHSTTLYLGTLLMGSQMNVMDMTFTQPDIVYSVKLVTPSIMFVQNDKISEIEEALKEAGLTIEIIVFGEEVDGHESFEEYLKASNGEINKFRPYRPDSIKRTAVIFFSSGTSGLPKGVCSSHENILVKSIVRLSAGLESPYLTFYSYYWVSTFVILAGTVLGGISRIVPLPFSDGMRMYNLIMKYKIATAFLNPTDLVKLIKTPVPRNLDVSSLRTLFSGGSSVRPALIRAAKEIFPNCLVCQLYGQTEAMGLITMWYLNNPKDVALLTANPGSVGKIFRGTWAKVVEEETGEILGPYQSGELCLKSDDGLMNGYYKKDNSEVFDENGWFRTGDLVYYDDYHCFYVIDRVKDLIKYQGWHIIPIILENLLLEYPAVSAAVVIGIPNDDDGEHPMGCVTLKQGVDPSTVNTDEIADFVNKQVEERKSLRAGVKIIRKIPRTSTGKIKRRFLRDAILRGENL